MPVLWQACAASTVEADQRGGTALDTAVVATVAILVIGRVHVLQRRNGTAGAQ